MAGPRDGPAARVRAILIISACMILSNLTACGAALRHKEDAGVGAPPHGALTHAAHVLSPRRRALLAVPTTKQSLEQPSNCTAWLPQRRVYVESQAWFTL